MKTYFVTGIGTDVGKTVVSSILCEALNADYWKPVQCGNLDHSDTETVRQFISNRKTKLHSEAYMFKTPASPHYASHLEHIQIDMNKIMLPETNNDLVIEGAGGLMVPLNQSSLMIDLIGRFKAEVILVSKNYLGSINHTLLSFDALKNRNIPVKALVFNGHENISSEQIITSHCGIKSVLHIAQESILDKEKVKEYAEKFIGLI